MLLQRALFAVKGQSSEDAEHDLGAAHREHFAVGCDGRARNSDEVSADHFLPVPDKAETARFRRIGVVTRSDALVSKRCYLLEVRVFLLGSVSDRANGEMTIQGSW